jgi:hypothetical protein
MEQLGFPATTCSISIWVISGTNASVFGNIPTMVHPGNREHRAGERCSHREPSRNILPYPCRLQACGYNPFDAHRREIPGAKSISSFSVNELPDSICLPRGSNHPLLEQGLIGIPAFGKRVKPGRYLIMNRVKAMSAHILGKRDTGRIETPRVFGTHRPAGPLAVLGENPEILVFLRMGRNKLLNFS